MTIAAHTVTAPAPLDARRGNLAALADGTWDVVIVGGGIVGSGALLDAVSRGMRAALIEQDDIAAGTSSRSSRLIHGGLRYLEQFRFGLVREALAERSRILHLAPHLVRLEPLLFPIYGDPVPLEGVLRHRPDAVRRARVPGTTAAGIAGSRRRTRWRSRRRSGTRAFAAACSTTTASRTTLDTRSPSRGQPIADGGLAVTRVRATGLRTSTRVRRRSRRSARRT